MQNYILNKDQHRESIKRIRLLRHMNSKKELNSGKINTENETGTGSGTGVVPWVALQRMHGSASEEIITSLISLKRPSSGLE